MTGLGPVLAFAGYAGLLWVIALALDAIGRRSLRPAHRRRHEGSPIGSDVAQVPPRHRRRGARGRRVRARGLRGRAPRWTGAPARPVAATCFAGAVRRVAPLWRDP